MLAEGDLPGWERYPECVADQPGTPIDDEIEGDLLQYSSGTTGRPKGIKRELPHVPPDQAPGMMSALVGFWMDPEAVYLSPAPLYHTAPSVWSMSVQAGGVTTVVLEKFDPEGTLDAIQRHRVTHGQFVPAMFVRMLKLPEKVRHSYDLSSLKRVMHAAAPCPVEIKKQMMDWWGPIIDEYYASSEAIGSTLISAEDWLAHPGSVGKPMLGGVHILDEDGNELPPGQAGEIYFEGGYSFEYLNDASKTAASRDKHGWMTVGDIGYLDDDGYLFLTDRRHHMIISGGVNTTHKKPRIFWSPTRRCWTPRCLAFPMTRWVNAWWPPCRPSRRPTPPISSPASYSTGCETACRTSNARGRSRSRRSCHAPTPGSSTRTR